MASYVSLGDLQRELTECHRSTGHRLQFQDAIAALARKGKCLSSPAENIRRDLHNMSDDAFDAYVDGLTFPVPSASRSVDYVEETGFFPLRRDVFVFRHPRWTRPELHSHDFWEIECVSRGSCVFHFEEEQSLLPTGTVVLIAPGSRHDIEVSDDISQVFGIMLRRSTFEATFFSLLSRDDALSLFFRTNLTGNREPNYLLFHTENRGDIRYNIRYALCESFLHDMYANSCCISLVNMLMASVLRSAGDSPQFYRYQAGTDFSHILHAIRHHYQTVTLTELAEQFHYSKPHLCTLIKQNTGVSFTDLLKQIRMSRATEYLLNTDLPVFEIAEIVGYHSADHFSRVFRGEFHSSPQEYRRVHTESDDRFVPFERQQA